jgi:hypothetical protein
MSVVTTMHGRVVIIYILWPFTLKYADGAASAGERCNDKYVRQERSSCNTLGSVHGSHRCCSSISQLWCRTRMSRQTGASCEIVFVFVYLFIYFLRLSTFIDMCSAVVLDVLLSSVPLNFKP